jgi:N,N'-diacetyllegionaminate synthase
VIIAELCQNHQGDKSLLKDMVDTAGGCGAKFAKIQSFFAEDLAPEWEHDKERLKKLELDWDTHARFVEWCGKAGVIPMTSVYTTGYLDKLWEAGFKWVKVGSAQSLDTELIKTYVEMGFKVVVSTGGHSLQEIPKIHPLAGVLHCVSQYPCKAFQANLIRMLDLRKYFPSVPYGFSSHIDPADPDCLDTLRTALFLGASFVEAHFTLRPRAETKDGPVSLDSAQLFELCHYDRLTFEQRLARNPGLGVLMYPQPKEERELIERYASRWKQQGVQG